MSSRFPGLSGIRLKGLALFLLALAMPMASASAADEPDLIFRRSTVFKWVSPNDKLATYGLDDPEVEGVACVERSLGLHQVAGEDDLLLGQPGDDVALGVPPAQELQHELAAVAAELDGELVSAGQRRPGLEYRPDRFGRAPAGKVRCP